jgi:hypothetical protein
MTMKTFTLIVLSLALAGCLGAKPAASPSPAPKLAMGRVIAASLDPDRPHPPRPSLVEIQRVPRAPRR